MNTLIEKLKRLPSLIELRATKFAIDLIDEIIDEICTEYSQKEPYEKHEEKQEKSTIKTVQDLMELLKSKVPNDGYMFNLINFEDIKVILEPYKDYMFVTCDNCEYYVDLDSSNKYCISPFCCSGYMKFKLKELS